MKFYKATWKIRAEAGRVFQARKGAQKCLNKKKNVMFYNTKLYFKMHVLFQEILSPKIIFIDF